MNEVIKEEDIPELDSNKVGKMTAYYIFDQERRYQLIATNPGIQPNEIARILGQQWRDLVVHQRLEYVQKATKMNAGTSGSVQIGTPSTSQAPEAPAPICNIQLPTCLNAKFDPHKSGRITAYIIFDRERRNEVKNRYPQLEFAEVSKFIGTLWHDLTQEEKDRYNDIAGKVNERRKKILENRQVAGDSTPRPNVRIQGSQIKCHICNTIWSHRKSFRKHLKRVHPPPPGPGGSDGYRSTNSGENSHQPSRYSCRLCNRMFVNTSDAYGHLEGQHRAFFAEKRHRYLEMFEEVT